MTIAIALSARISSAVTCPAWQKRQQVVSYPDGSAVITIEDCAIDEIVRWAMGYGLEARVVAPLEAIGAARSYADSLVCAYSAATGRAEPISCATL